MKKIKLLVPAMAILFFSCKKEIRQNETAQFNDEQAMFSPEQINRHIHDVINAKGLFEWKDASDEMIWSALKHSDRIISVGYKPFSEINVDKRLAEINIHDAAWLDAKQQVLSIIYNEEKQHNKLLNIAEIELWPQDKIPVINVKVSSLKAIKILRSSRFVRYAEPTAYDPVAYEKNNEVESGGGSGCGGYTGDNSLQNNKDYTIITPNAKASWNHQYMGIAGAWTKSSGSGVKLMVIDTGTSPGQENLGSSFNQGLSIARTIERIATLPGSGADDDCGHGTAMCGAAAAPRGTDGNAAGVAYNCNLVACRAAYDVYLDASEETVGVSNAFTYAGDDASVKIISMSMGRILTSSQIQDAIRYAYGKGKLIFCAGGTSFSWTAGWFGVTFPGNMSEVQGITGIMDGEKQKACEDCHKGKEIDFVIVMEKKKNGLHALTTAISGDVPATVGGSSVSTATAAGIAALVWSRFPSYSRADVVNKLTTTASNYPSKSKNFGWGVLNADAATD